MQFTPVEDFDCPELGSVYCAGMTYTVRPGNEKLAAFVEQWVKDGWVRTEGKTTVRLAGKGEIKTRS